MSFRYAAHADEEISRRGIPREVVDAILRKPEEKVPGFGGRQVYQSLHKFKGGKVFLVRVVVDERLTPPLVVTVYRTSKIAKYRRKAT